MLGQYGRVLIILLKVEREFRGLRLRPPFIEPSLQVNIKLCKIHVVMYWQKNVLRDIWTLEKD